MKKSTYIHGKIAMAVYNSTELLAQALISKRPPEDIQVSKNVAYGDVKNRERLNLIFQRQRSDDKQPLLLYIHGGGWISGHLNLRNTYCTEYVKKGFFCASVDYQYAPNEVFPYQLNQCFKAIDWLFDHAEEYKIDMTKILVAGESAGSYFISYLAAVAADPTPLDKLGIEFKHRDEFKVTALISICGAVDMVRLCDSKFFDMQLMVKCFSNRTPDYIRDNKDKEEIKLLSPSITEQFPPSVLVYGTHDLLKIESFAMHEQLKALGVPCLLVKADGIISQHAWALALIVEKGRQCLSTTMQFVLPYFEK